MDLNFYFVSIQKLKLIFLKFNQIVFLKSSHIGSRELKLRKRLCHQDYEMKIEFMTFFWMSYDAISRS